MKYYYITNQQVLGTDYVSSHLLYTEDKLKEDRYHVIRVQIPEGCKLYQKEDGFIAKDDRILDQLGYDILIFKNKEWVEWNCLKSYKPHKFGQILQIQGYNMVPKIGYLDKQEFRDWFRKSHPEIFEKKKRGYNTSFKSRRN